MSDGSVRSMLLCTSMQTVAWTCVSTSNTTYVYIRISNMSTLFVSHNSLIWACSVIETASQTACTLPSC